MAFRTWAQTLGTAAGAAFIAAASQLGVGSGLGLLRWDADFASRAAWHTQLTWLAFIAALATVAGAAVAMWAPAGFTGSTAAERQPRWARALLSAAAAVGAAAIIPVATHPSHGVHIPEPGGAGHAATAAMLLGVLVGAGLAYLTLTVPAVAGNMVTYAIWLWLAALACALWTLSRAAAPGVDPEPVASSAGKLGLIPPGGGWTATVLLLGIPGVIAFGAASVSRFGGGGRAAVAASGAAGPALVAGAYLIGGRGGGTQTVAFWCALGGVAVGAAVSAFVALARRIPRPDFIRPAYQRSGAPRPEYAGHRRDLDEYDLDGYDLDGYDDEPGAGRHGGGEAAQPWDREDPWDRDGSAGDTPATWRPRGYSEPPDRLADALRSPTDDHSIGAAESTGRGSRRSDTETTGSHRLPDWSSFDASSLSAESTSSVNTAGAGASSDTSSSSGSGSHTGEWRMPADEPAPAASRWPGPVDVQPEPELVPQARPAVEDLWSTPAPEPVSTAWTPAPAEAAAPPAVPAQPNHREPSSFATPSFPTPSAPTPTPTTSFPAPTTSFPASGGTSSSFATPAPGRTGRDRSSSMSIFDSPPAPEVPAAPSSRSRSSSIFDAPPPPEAPALRPGLVRRDRDDSRRPPVVPDPFDDLDAPFDSPSSGSVPFDAEPVAPQPVSPAPAAPAQASLPAWAEHLSGDYPIAEPAPAPTGKASKRGRRKGEQQEAPVVHAKDAEYVDWFKDLRGSGRSADKS